MSVADSEFSLEMFYIWRREKDIFFREDNASYVNSGANKVPRDQLNWFDKGAMLLEKIQKITKDKNSNDYKFTEKWI